MCSAVLLDMIVFFPEILIDVVCYFGADLLHVFSYLPKDLNFIEHTSDIGWKE